MHLNGRSYRLGALLSTRTSVIYHYKKVRPLELPRRREFHIEKDSMIWPNLGKSALTKEIYI
jgi:hypothetical protein